MTAARTCLTALVVAFVATLTLGLVTGWIWK
jgi:hypothetical protein